ncbi:hypothetical protein SNOG_13159 [Parastagonospora nodorum SN15]|uniref:NAD(P)-binding domain-containing protein n=1 Tax=Phaeosphaeria nodorum (strain SN15 / ATCC MYA-4574 / FGSC 10173) TaxID=321614 RepID=Q0U505_PHANO|nr:hypothetical protein SNOG_13159 [Parastagonospora nodorum SN15]EAT79486.1 hypothetical protein SNOG_13159 [Parastagonospora nodorum SN15]
MTTAVLAGSTGQVGSSILTLLLAHPNFTSIHAYTRKPLSNPDPSSKLTPITSTDPSSWPSLFPRTPTPKIMFSGLATTRDAAGGFDNQRKIDYDLNLDLAKAAKDAGVETYVLISAAGASAKSPFAYVKMKGELEDSIKALGFKHTVFVKPGFIAGERSNRKVGVAEMGLRWLAQGMGGCGAGVEECVGAGWGDDC